MFCYQCQEAAKGSGCVIKGVCGKSDEVANLQDLLIYLTKGLSYFAGKYEEAEGVRDDVNKLVTGNLFSTITNVNFDKNFFLKKIGTTLAKRDELYSELTIKGIVLGELPDAATWFSDDNAEILKKSESVGILATENEDVRSLRELLTYGLKGMAAYLYHANNLKHDSAEASSFIHKAMAATLDDSLSGDDLIGLVMECGKYGVDVMALLDNANTSAYGNPEITKVNLGVRNKPGILISGHDLKDMEELLAQTEGTGVDVYTHSEMLPAHYYPAFKKYEHFVGNYGNAWWEQTSEFESFNGPIVMTTNCLVPPRDSYKERVYTTGVVGFEGLKEIKENGDGTKDFSEIIEHAKRCASPVQIEEGEIVGGFAHNQVLSLADKVIEAVKEGAIKKFVVMAGCDGRSNARGYYTDFANELPNDSVILTAGCAKYKYNKLDLGDIGGIPRVLDAGQCNDSYSLAVIALKLKEAFGLEDINELPIVYNIAWYEQKAVIVLLALLYLGVKNIHLGPTLPAFLSPNVAKVLVETFGIGGITNAKEDIEKMILEKTML